jgi:hypothetical protein
MKWTWSLASGVALGGGAFPRGFFSLSAAAWRGREKEKNDNTRDCPRFSVELDAGECEKSLGVVGIDDEGLWKTILCIYINYLHSMVA